MLYGKWRPQNFSEVVGQEHIVRTLRNALATGQVAHAYLFCGPRGTGKTTTARILARAVNCLSLVDGEPCNACAPCQAIARGNALDMIEMDAASNRGIDDVRELREKIAFAPSDLQKKVYLLDEVHMLTEGAFNALLKTLEEPPPHAFFILATTEHQKVPATIRSRCQRFDFHRVADQAMVGRLRHIAEAEGYALPDEGLRDIARQARGGMRDAITLLEQVVARYGATPTPEDVRDALGLVHDPRSEQLAAALLEGDLATCLDLAREVAGDGLDLARFTGETIDILRDILPAVLRNNANASEHPELAGAVLQGGRGARPVTVAIAELARADFRLDPGNPVLLEVACAGALLAPSPVQAATAAVAAPGGARQGAPPPRPPGSGPRPPADGGPELSREERFLRDLRNQCSVVNTKAGAFLNGSCEIVSLGDDAIELGFFYDIHMEKAGGEYRDIIEEQAAIILGKPAVTLKLSRVERQQGPRRARSTGHLAEAARALGATPVEKG